jgi:hypothetical protein
MTRPAINAAIHPNPSYKKIPRERKLREWQREANTKFYHDHFG